MKIISTLIIILSLFSTISAQWHFSNSLHKIRSGFETAYKTENHGMEKITNIPFEDLACKKCHSSSGLYQNGDPIPPQTYTPICVDCHDFQNTLNVTEGACLSCHQRQLREKEIYYGIDVHTNEGMTCLSCHTKEEVHGDNNMVYVSLKDSGAVHAKCINCHTQISNNGSHNRHRNTVDCSACHAVSVYSCAGCHFESFITTEKKTFNNELTNYRLLIKKDGMVKLGAIVTHSFNGKTNYIISSTHSHIIKKNATRCSDCHRGMGQINQAIQEYNDTGYITLTKWDSTSKKIIIPHQVIPIPGDWMQSLKIDHSTYTGDPTIFPFNPDLWQYLKSETDNAHLYYAEPLDSLTLAKLGFTRFPTNVEFDLQTPIEFYLNQNYPNPFNPSTIISFQLPITSYINLKVYDVLGKEILSLVDEIKSAGSYEVEFNATRLSSGIYFYRLQAGSFVQTKKMLMIK